jgi:hypothetical protein
MDLGDGAAICVACMENNVSGNNICENKHRVLCSGCCMLWSRKSTTCPICRQNLMILTMPNLAGDAYVEVRPTSDWILVVRSKPGSVFSHFLRQCARWQPNISILNYDALSYPERRRNYKWITEVPMLYNPSTGQSYHGAKASRKLTSLLWGS